MDINDWRSLFTLATFAIFIAIVVWAYSAHRKQPYEEAARLPLEDDDIVVTEAAAGRSSGHVKGK
jgi:cytochrome c oxidase cbb3-type subunit 4